MNPISIENTRQGTEDWKLEKPVTEADFSTSEYRTPAIEGYASLTSVNKGGTIDFYVSTTAPEFSLEIFRLGYYGGAGGRRMPDTRVTLPGIDQPTPALGEENLIECDWQLSHSLTIPDTPDDWVSGVYVAKLEQVASTAPGKQSYIIFVVRDDSRRSDLLFQSSVTTFHAYNGWGGSCCYADPYSPRGVGRKVSFNRPYFTSFLKTIEWNGDSPNISSKEQPNHGAGAGHFLTQACNTYNRQPAGVVGWEYHLVRWLEKEAYDVTYCTNIDVHRDPQLLLSHKGFFSVGHDEYWSRDMRLNVEQARDHGVHLAFFSCNSVFNQVRFEPSPLTGEPNRVMVYYGGGLGDDPVLKRIQLNTATNDDRFPYRNVAVPFSNEHINNNAGIPQSFKDAIADYDWSEETLLGSTWSGESGKDQDFILEPGAITALPWLFTNIETPPNGLLPLRGLAGYEPNAVRNPHKVPAGILTVARYSLNPNYPMNVYTAASGAIVLVTNSAQWCWGLDDFTFDIDGHLLLNNRTHPIAQQMTRNLLARFGASQWTAVDDAHAITAMVSHKDSLFATFGNKLWRRGAVGPDTGDDWRDMGKVERVTAMASHQGKLYAAFKDKIYRREKFGHDTDDAWKKIADAEDINAMASHNGALYVVSGDMLWKIGDVSEHGFKAKVNSGKAYSVTAMTSHQGELYAVSNNRLWKRAALGPNTENDWIDCGETRGVTALASHQGQLYAASNNKLWILSLEKIVSHAVV